MTTKLQKYLEIIRILIVNGPLDLEQMETLLGINKISLNKDVDFLEEQNIIKRTRGLNGLSTYVATPLGIRIAKYFRHNT
jgi:DeoR/GlpR family transcriptional regulator of sugar metabolism